jgi:beta-mannosidase
MTNRRAMEALVPEADRWPADRSNPVYRHLGEWWNNAALVHECFGGRLHELESMRTASQFLQATGLAYAIEADRRRSPRLSMVLPWQLGESYPNAWCTSVVDYRGEPKPSFFAATRAFAPTRVTVRTDRTAWGGHAQARIEIWAWADHGVGVETIVRARAKDPFGRILSSCEFRVAPVADPRQVGVFEVDLDGVPDVFVWDLEWCTTGGEVLDREVVIATSRATLEGLLTLGPAQVETSVNWIGSIAEVSVRHVAGPLVPALRLRDARPPGEPGSLLTTGDPRPLLPSEERILSVDFAGTTSRRGAVLEGWNLAEMKIGQP